MKITPKNDFDGWQFATPTEMTEVLQNELEPHGFTGEVKSYTSQGETVWRLAVKVPGKADQYVYLKSSTDPNMATWLVWDGVTPQAYTQTDFDPRFNITESQD